MNNTLQSTLILLYTIVLFVAVVIALYKPFVALLMLFVLTVVICLIAFIDIYCTPRALSAERAPLTPAA